MKKTKIICTIGPKTESEEMLKLLLINGMDVMRLNFSHGDHQEHKKRIKNLRKAIKTTGRNAAIMLDTKGPEIRTMSLQDNKEIYLKKNQDFILSIDQSIIGNSEIVAINYPIIKDIKTGHIILIDDGNISMKVVKIKNNNIFCKLLNSGILGNNKSINCPEIFVEMPVLNEKDKLDLIFGCKQKVDFIAASFVRKDEDIKKIRLHLNKHEGKNIKIISKIENQEGLNNFDNILNISDGIMIARGDLGVEIPIEQVILVQKNIIKKCNQTGKIVITATHMLESMIKNPRPTRAEAGDVANAILDGTDAVMLSGESAKGNYPLKALQTMYKICNLTDKVIKNFYVNIEKINYKKTIYKNIVEISEIVHASLIIIFTSTGKLAIKIRKYFPSAFILALTDNKYTIKQLLLIRGVIPFLIEKKSINTLNNFFYISKKIIIKNNLANLGDSAILLYQDNFISTQNKINDYIIYIKKL